MGSRLVGGLPKRQVREHGVLVAGVRFSPPRLRIFMSKRFFILTGTIAVTVSLAVITLVLVKFPPDDKENIIGGTSEATKTQIANFVNQTIQENRDVEIAQEEQHEEAGQVKTGVSEAQQAEEIPAIESCVKDPNNTRFECYEEYYVNLVREKDIKTAFSDLRVRYNEDDYVRAQCHPLTHVIGRVAAEKFANVAGAYTEGDSFCWSGYYHGVLEGVIGKIGMKDLVVSLNDICMPLAEAHNYSFDHYNCAHGLGHGVMAITQNELFDSLKLCDNLVDAWERASCWSGAFMENIIIDNQNQFTKYLKPTDPLYPCNAVDDQYRNVCYLMQTSYMLKITNGDYVKVFELCTQAEGYQNTCYQSLGRDISGRNTSDVALTKTGCALGRDLLQREQCIVGAVKDFVSYFHSDVQGKALCAALDEKEIQDTCFATLDEYYKIF